MPQATEKYRGFSITVVPMKDCGDLWDYEYRLLRLDSPAGKDGPEIRRLATAGGHATPEIAMVAGLVTAKTEVDNLLALEGGRP